ALRLGNAGVPLAGRKEEVPRGNDSPAAMLEILPGLLGLGRIRARVEEQVVSVASAKRLLEVVLPLELAASALAVGLVLRPLHLAPQEHERRVVARALEVVELDREP